MNKPAPAIPHSRQLYTSDLNSNLSHHKRDREYGLQRRAPRELKRVSQPPGVAEDALPGYIFDKKAGEGITVYMIDFGINENGPVSAFSKDSSRI